MKRNETIASRLHEVFLNGHWIANTNYKVQIQIINCQQATQKVSNLSIDFSYQLLFGGFIRCF